MRWLKVEQAAAEWCGGLSPKTLYRAIREGRLRAARIGAGRNLLCCEAWCDEWLTASAKAPAQDATARYHWRKSASVVPSGEPQLQDAGRSVDVLQRRAVR